MNCIFSFLFIITTSSFASSQVFNRANANLSYGYDNHWNWGAHGYFLNHFTIGISAGHSSEKTGPVACSSTGLFTTKCKQLKDIYRDFSLLGGVSTHLMEKKLDVDLQAGIVWQRASINENIKLHYNEYSHSEWLTHTSSYPHTIGFVVQGNMHIECSRGFGFLITAEKHFNAIRPAFNIMAGIEIGIVQDYWLKRE